MDNGQTIDPNVEKDKFYDENHIKIVEFLFDYIKNIKSATID